MLNIPQNGLVVGIGLREMAPAVEVMPAAVGGGIFFSCAVTKGLMRGFLDALMTLSVFGRPIPNNFVALMGVWLLWESIKIAA